MAQRDEPSGLSRAILAIGTALGMNRVRLTWRLQRLDRWLDDGTAAQRARQATRICRHCGAVQPMDATTCGSCNEKLGSALWSRLGKIGLTLPQAGAATGLLGLLMAGIYARMIVATNGEGLMSFDVITLVTYGARIPDTLGSGEYWRLGTAMFLHIGLWHAGFNLFALSQVGPAIELAFGRARMLFFFLATGVIGFVASDLFSDAVSAGASGGLMGLIGVAAAWGHRQPTGGGRELRDRMVKWAVYTMVFGYFIGADNAAHAGGFISGGLLGLVARDTRSESNNALGILGALTCVALVALSLSGLGGRAVEPYREAASYEDEAGCDACIQEHCALGMSEARSVRFEDLLSCYSGCKGDEAQACGDRCRAAHPEAVKALEQLTNCATTHCAGCR